MIYRLWRLTLLVGLSVFLAAACGKQPATDSSAGQPATAAATSAPATPAASPAEHKSAAEESTEASTVTRVNEDGSETVEETTADNSAHNPLLAAVVSSAAAATTTAAPSPWQEGVNYTRLVPAQPTSVPAGQIEVLEFFWYACPHCYALDPLIESWRKTKPPYISFSRVPVMWGEGHRSLARLFYTLESMGKLDELHTAIFKEIHVKNDPLVDLNNDEAQSERIQTAFVTKLGIPEAAFHSAYHSFAVETALQRADQLVQRYRITAVPTFVVNGKYVADVATAGGEERLVSLIGDLAATEHKR
jgi:thiol:disulfide interchange protein DsbA